MIAKPITSWSKDSQQSVEAQKARKTVKRQFSWRLCPFVSSWVICACSWAALEAPSSPTRTPWILLWSTCTAAEDASVYVRVGPWSCPRCTTRSTPPWWGPWWSARGQQQDWWRTLCICSPMRVENKGRRRQRRRYPHQERCWVPPRWWRGEVGAQATLFWKCRVSPLLRGFLLPTLPPPSRCRLCRSPPSTWWRFLTTTKMKK